MLLIGSDGFKSTVSARPVSGPVAVAYRKAQRKISLVAGRMCRECCKQSLGLKKIVRREGNNLSSYNDKLKAQDHYNRVSPFHRSLWGGRLHHGYWVHDESKEAAPLQLVEQTSEAARLRVNRLRRVRMLDLQRMQSGHASRTPRESGSKAGKRQRQSMGRPAHGVRTLARWRQRKFV